MTEESLEKRIEEAADLVIESERIVVFTGAGVSTESGIPDFRSPGGVWSKYDPDEFTYQRFVTDPGARKKTWRMLLETGMIREAEPNLAHYAIAELDRLGKLDCVITQNVDNLHQKAGVPGDKAFELHGNLQWVVCLGCGMRYPFAQMIARLERDQQPPDCESCHGILKPDGVFFGELLPEKVLAEATLRSKKCDLFIVIGSSLVVAPAAYMPSYALHSGAKLVIVNLGSTHMDGEATVLIRAKAGEAMSQIIRRVKEKIGT